MLTCVSANLGKNTFGANFVQMSNVLKDDLSFSIVQVLEIHFHEIFVENQKLTIFSEVKCTVWNFQNFSATQILREIIVGESGASRIAILTHLEALNFDFHGFLHFLKVGIDLEIKIQSFQNCKSSIF